jgi:hypothetical protein
VESYLKRGFQQSEAEILVLLEECAAGLFAAFPDRFVLVGGATLVLFYDSPRLSRDLDLLAKAEELPTAAEIITVIEESIQPLAETFGLGKIECVQGGTKDFIKIWVQSNQKPLFSVDLTRIGGTVLKCEEVQKQIGESNEKTVIIPSAEALLFQKCETFLDRRFVKCRDAFDIDVLIGKGATLSGALKDHLHDFIQMREFDSGSIRDRINQVNTKLCTAELRPALPDALFTTLAHQEFEPLRSALEKVFCDWL